MIDAWVDGSFRNKTCGWSFVVLEDGEYLCEECGSDIPSEFLVHRNVAGEIFAVLKLLDFCRENDVSKVRIYHDYTGLQAWAEGTFKSNTVLTKYYKNYVQASGIGIEWVKIESHTGDTWNEYADKLAKYAVGSLEEPPALPEGTVKAEKEEQEEELDESIDIYALNHVNLREMLDKKQAEAADTIPQPVQDIPQMAYSSIAPKHEETLTKDEAFRRAGELAGEERYHEAYLLLKPFMNNTLTDKEIACCLHTMVFTSASLAHKAAETAERILRVRHGSRLIQREYCLALYYGSIVPCVISLNLTGEEYEAAKAACMALLSVSSSSPMIIDMVLPFMRTAYRAGDRAFLNEVKNRVNPAVISDDRTFAGSKRQEFLALVR